MSSAVFLHEYKIAVVGECGVGKSALTIQFFQNKFVEDWDPMIEDSNEKQIIVDDEVIVIDVLDTAWQTDFADPMSLKYLQTREGFLMVYSITSKASFDMIPWMYEEMLKVKDQWPIVLVGTRCDMEDEREVAASDGRSMSRQLGECPFMECSAKLRLNIDEAFIRLVQRMKAFNKVNHRISHPSLVAPQGVPKGNDSPGCCGGCVIL